MYKYNQTLKTCYPEHKFETYRLTLLVKFYKTHYLTGRKRMEIPTTPLP